MTIFIVLSTGCQKNDDLNLSGTKWKGSVENLWITLYFKNSKSVELTIGEGFEHQTETFPYTVSGNLISVNCEGEVLRFEKVEKYLYWDMSNISGTNMTLKLVQQ